MLKPDKLMLILCSIGLINSYAEVPRQKPNKECISLQCSTNYWELGLTGEYLQLQSSLTHPSLPTYHSNFASESIWNGAFIIDAAYHFNNHNDIKLSWQHFSETDSTSGTHIKDTHIIPQEKDPIYTVYPKTQLDAIDLDLGRLAYLGPTFSLKLRGGLSYVALKAKRTQYNYGLLQDLSDEDGNETIRYGNWYTGILQSHYEGVGPQISGEISKDMGHGISAFAHSALGLLIGKSKASADTNLAAISSQKSQTRTLLLQANYVNQNTYTSNNVVPNFDAKVGLSYKIEHCNSVTEIMAGWSMQYYFDAFLNPNYGMSEQINNGPFFIPGETQQPAPNLIQIDPVLTNATLMSSTLYTSLALSGPFLKVRWQGSV